MVSPVPKALVTISVLSISPTMIRMVCARRRGILRRPSMATTAVASRKTTSIARMMSSIGAPKSVFIEHSSSLTGRPAARRRPQPSRPVSRGLSYRLQGASRGEHAGHAAGAPTQARILDAPVTHAHDAVGALAHLQGVGHQHHGLSLLLIQPA